MIKKYKNEFSEDYLTDASNFRGDADVLYVPQDKDELKYILREAYKNNQKMTVQGSRTGLTGSATPLNGIIISTEKLDNIIKIDTLKQTALLEPGVIISDFQNELKGLKDRPNGFFYPPNPTEQNSTIGGNVSTAASGARTFKYGTTRDFVTKLNVILSNGDELLLARGENIESDGRISLKSVNGVKYKIPIRDINMPKVKHAAGYFIKKGMDAIDLFIGSEGTLGVISEIEVKINPNPECLMGGLVFFDNINKMLDFVDIVRDSSLSTRAFSIESNTNISARLIEFFDDRSLSLLSSSFQEIPDNVSGAIWFEQEYASSNEQTLMNKWYSLIKSSSIFHNSTWFAIDEVGHRKLSEFRHELPLKVFELIKQYDSIKIGTDSAVKSVDLHHYYHLIKNSLDDSELVYFVWGHIGNAHLHANILTKNDKELKSAYKLYENFLKEAIRLGGTVSAEHGIGKLKKDYLRQLYGSETIAYMQKIKNIFDDKNLLGFGNLF